jgi:diguanylate cyclase
LHWIRSILCLLIAACSATAQATPLLLEDKTRTYDAWPNVRVLADADRTLSVEAALARLDKFAPPNSAHAAMGFRKEAIWLHVPVIVAPQSDGKWILEVDYALLNRLDVFVARDGKARHLGAMGNLQPRANRPLSNRTPAIALDLVSGARHDLLVRVDTKSSLILPIRISKPGAFVQRTTNEFMLQGFLVAIGFCLLFFSLQQWHSLGDGVYGRYALLIVCNLFFSAHLFGLGAHYLWTDNAWLETHVAGISSLLTSCATALFVEGVLGDDLSRRIRATLRVLAGLLAGCAVLYAFDLLSTRLLGIVMGVIGLLPVLLGLPGALARARRGDSVGWYFMLAWGGYFLSGAVLWMLVTGRFGASFWTLHSLQFGNTIDMLIFMRIVILRTAAAHLAAQHASRDRDALHSLAHSDPLTGLYNRRGLNAALSAVLPHATPQHSVAMYMMDLDGFKPVNDQHGHDVGDELLERIAQRLRDTVRATDIVARVGGDEFVVVATGLHSERQAVELGDKLVAAFKKPFKLKRHTCNVGVTIGFVLAPEDGQEALALTKLADAAMYTGKQRGKGALVRSERPFAS